MRVRDIPRLCGGGGVWNPMRVVGHQGLQVAASPHLSEDGKEERVSQDKEMVVEAHLPVES